MEAIQKITTQPFETHALYLSPIRLKGTMKREYL